MSKAKLYIIAPVLLPCQPHSGGPHFCRTPCAHPSSPASGGELTAARGLFWSGAREGHFVKQSSLGKQRGGEAGDSAVLCSLPRKHALQPQNTGAPLPWCCFYEESRGVAPPHI